MKNDCSDLGVTFSFDETKFGKTVNRELRPNGANINVTEENKQEYIKEICYAKMAKNIKP